MFNNCFLILSFYVIYVNKSNINDAISKERHKRASKVGTKVQLAFGRDEDGFYKRTQYYVFLFIFILCALNGRIRDARWTKSYWKLEDKEFEDRRQTWRKDRSTSVSSSSRFFFQKIALRSTPIWRWRLEVF